MLDTAKAKWAGAKKSFSMKFHAVLAVLGSVAFDQSDRLSKVAEELARDVLPRMQPFLTPAVLCSVGATTLGISIVAIYLRTFHTKDKLEYKVGEQAPPVLVVAATQVAGPVDGGGEAPFERPCAPLPREE